METAVREHWIAVDFHTHTNYSNDGLMTPQELVEICRRRGLGRVVVTDHNTIQGALAAKKIDPQLVIVGEEVMTTGGEVLAAFVSEEIPAGLSPLEAVRRLREQGAFISLSHPFDVFRTPWQETELLAILPFIDAIETFNSRCLLPRFNLQAQRFAQTHDLVGTVGSDAHTRREVGAARLLLAEFHSAEELRSAICSSQAKAHRTGLLVHFMSKMASTFRAARKETF